MAPLSPHSRCPIESPTPLDPACVRANSMTVRGNESRDEQRVGQVFRIWGLALFLFLAS